MPQGPEPIVIFYLRDQGRKLAERLADYFPYVRLEKYSREKVARYWPGARALVFIMACGVAVRAIGSLLSDKKTDPAVVVLDETGKFAVSLLSGHLGGANELAREIAALLGGEAVVTTASDLAGLPALDLWAETHQLVLEPEELVPEVTARYLNRKTLKVFLDYPVPIPDTWEAVDHPEEADLVVSYRNVKVPKTSLSARPRVLFLGIGFHEETTAKDLEEAVRMVFETEGLALSSLQGVGTIDRRDSHEGLCAWVRERKLSLKSFSPEELKRAVERFGLAPSFAAQTRLGTPAVAEPAALLSAGPEGRLLVGKTKVEGISIAVALGRGPTGKLFVVGTGPGGLEEITPLARKALREASHIVGYHRYIELIKPILSSKEIHTTGMTQEVDRVRLALSLAAQGHRVALVSGGDPGIYGLAGLVFEILQEAGLFGILEVEVVSGVSALNACAARLGAPLMHDFAVLSLSDRLTPWETIERRLRAAAEADFVIVIYNPKSRRRDHLARAREILLEYRPGNTPVGLARAVSREEESFVITTLEKMLDYEIDMQTTVFIGNSETFVFHNWMVTPRGYKGRRF